MNACPKLIFMDWNTPNNILLWYMKLNWNGVIKKTKKLKKNIRIKNIKGYKLKKKWVWTLKWIT